MYSEDESDYEEPVEAVTPTGHTPKATQSNVHQRRKQLPCPQVEAGPGLWSLLRKHIGECTQWCTVHGSCDTLVITM